MAHREDRARSGHAPSCRSLVIFGVLAGFGAAVTLILIAPGTGSLPAEAHGPKHDSRRATTDEDPHWIFDDLCPEEMRVVAEYVMAELPGTLPTGFGANLKADFISGASAIELIQPPKAEALRFLDNPSSSPPPRFARVTVVRPTRDPPDVMEFRVGPLRGCDVARCSEPWIDADEGEVTPLLPDGQVSLQKRPMDMGDNSLDSLIQATLIPIKDLLVASFGKVWPPTVIPISNESVWSDGSEGKVWYFVFNDIASTAELRISRVDFFWVESDEEFQANWLHPLPFALLVEERAAIPALREVSYCGAAFPTAEALRGAYESGKVPTCKAKGNVSTEGTMGDWDVPGAPAGARDRSDLPAPRLEQPGGARFTLSANRGGNGGRYVAWYGWGAFVTMRPSTGLALLDLSFKGQRVAYELALSEALASYSGACLRHGACLAPCSLDARCLRQGRTAAAPSSTLIRPTPSPSSPGISCRAWTALPMRSTSMPPSSSTPTPPTAGRPWPT